MYLGADDNRHITANVTMEDLFVLLGVAYTDFKSALDIMTRLCVPPIVSIGLNTSPTKTPMMAVTRLC
jgi:hypothetical protein